MASGDALGPLEPEIATALFELQPTWAVALGRHEYDGRLPDYSRVATDAWLVRADALLGRLAGVDEAGLPPDRRIDRFLLRLLLESAAFDLREAGRLENNPMAYLAVLSLTPYLVREYAPPPVRAGAIVRAFEGMPRVLEEGRRRLAGPMPRPFVVQARSMGEGLPAHFAEAEAFAAGAGLAPEAAAARTRAEAAVRAFVAWLVETELPRAVDAFALGEVRYQRLLFVREGIEAPFAEIERAGAADLARNRARLEEIARTEHAPISAVIARLQRDHPPAEALLATARGYVEESRRFVESHGLVSIPAPVEVRVEETPPWGRATTTAAMDAPGPFDLGTAAGVYYVTPVDPAWSPAQQEEWLRTMHRSMLGNITVHEVYPGHYLQALHFRAAAGSLARKLYTSPSFVEGWAHYCEQLAIEAGLGADHPGAEVAQLLDALLRDCRLLASVRMHTRGWTVEQATRLFETEGLLDRLPAEREALRGTADPEYFCYTLGKLAILDVRRHHLGPTFGGEARAFHDALLATGAPPVGLLDALLAPAGAPSAGEPAARGAYTGPDA